MRLMRWNSVRVRLTLWYVLLLGVILSLFGVILFLLLDRGLDTQIDDGLRLSAEGLTGIEQLLSTPLADAHAAGLGDRARRDALAVVTSSYEEHGGFRLRTLSA